MSIALDPTTERESMFEREGGADDDLRALASSATITLEGGDGGGAGAALYVAPFSILFSAVLRL